MTEAVCVHMALQLGQVRMIAERMAAMREAVAGPVALFLMGDFNSTANSAVYRFLQARSARVLSLRRLSLACT